LPAALFAELKMPMLLQGVKDTGQEGRAFQF
jgi:hypothetical protein